MHQEERTFCRPFTVFTTKNTFHYACGERQREREGFQCQLRRRRKKGFFLSLFLFLSFPHRTSEGFMWDQKKLDKLYKTRRRDKKVVCTLALLWLDHVMELAKFIWNMKLWTFLLTERKVLLRHCLHFVPFFWSFFCGPHSQSFQIDISGSVFRESFISAWATKITEECLTTCEFTAQFSYNCIRTI